MNLERSSVQIVYNDITTRLLIISCINIMLTISTALYAGSVYHMSYNNIVLNIIPTLYEGSIVSVHRMIMGNRPVDPASIQGSHRPIPFIRRKKLKHENDFFLN